MNHDPHDRRLPDRLRRQLDETERSLLRIHKALLDHERIRYEQSHSRIGGPAALLQLVIHDPWFAWLRPVSQLAARIDELVRSKQPADARRGEALLAEACQLLSPSENGDPFQREYHRVMSESSEVAAMHAQWRRWCDTEGVPAST